jgi:hypothetical protein
MFIGRFYNITFKVMGEMRKFITQEVFLPAWPTSARPTVH